MMKTNRTDAANAPTTEARGLSRRGFLGVGAAAVGAAAFGLAGCAPQNDNSKTEIGRAHV